MSSTRVCLSCRSMLQVTLNEEQCIVNLGMLLRHASVALAAQRTASQPSLQRNDSGASSGISRATSEHTGQVTPPTHQNPPVCMYTCASTGRVQASTKDDSLITMIATIKVSALCPVALVLRWASMVFVLGRRQRECGGCEAWVESGAWETGRSGCLRCPLERPSETTTRSDRHRNPHYIIMPSLHQKMAPQK